MFPQTFKVTKMVFLEGSILFRFVRWFFVAILTQILIIGPRRPTNREDAGQLCLAVACLDHGFHQPHRTRKDVDV